MTTARGGAREGAGRPPRQEPKALPIWVGQISQEDRALILEWLTPEERYDALMYRVEMKQNAEYLEKWLEGDDVDRD